MSTVLRTGQTIAGYRVEDLLASGGMGVVYRATQLSLGRTVALKVLAPHLSADPEFRERFRREAAMQARLEHPHIVTVYEAGESEEGLFLALRYVEGTDLRRLIESGELSPARALDLLEQVASALDAAHELGLVHRDVKPQNVLVSRGDRAYLADFGLTKSDDVRELTKAGTYLGSLDYASPEHVRGEPVTEASDRYAFAAVLYECLAGEVPYPRDTEAAVLYAHVSEPPPRVSERRPELPAALDAVVARGLAKQPSERFPSATELVNAAQAAFELNPTGPPLSERTAQPASNSRRQFDETVVDPGVLRHAPVIVADEARGLPARWVLAAAGLLCAGLGAAGFLLGHSWTHVRHSPLGVAVAGPIQLSFPTGDWQPARVPRGTEQRNPVALKSRRAEGTLVAGMTPSVNAKTLLPSGTRPRGKRSLVRLGRYDAVRYRSRGAAQNADLYAVPVGAGAATIVCRGKLITLERCESVASTLLLRGVTPATVGPDPRYAAPLRTLFRRVDAARSAERRALSRADKPGERAGHAEVLASAFATAAVQLGGIPSGVRERPAKAALQRALARARDGYVSLAAALRARDHDAYLAASKRIRKAERQADAALRSLRALGYRVQR
jgi:predicted Ser/Thr protein kinase